jgi:hypothetical protein
MPITLANRHLYPPQWGEISRAVKESAGWRCQHPGCTAHQYSVGYWEGEAWRELGRFGIETPQPYKSARQYAAEAQWNLTGDDPEAQKREKVIVIVLTTAHLDHNPANCAPENLAAMCQRHHLAYDQQHHNESAYTTRMKKRGNLELPL